MAPAAHASLASANIDPSNFQSESDGSDGSRTAMAAPGRISALTTGSGQSNNVMRVLVHEENPPRNPPALQLVKRAVMEFKPSSKIFVQPPSNLRTDLRAHAFPPKDPAGAPPAKVVYRQHSAAGASHLERHPSEQEGGRMHPHRDQPGTDAVVLLNLGSCDFFFDDNATGKKACNCKAQLTKECWCIGPEGGKGHWAKAVDCEGRYGEASTRTC